MSDKDIYYNYPLGGHSENDFIKSTEHNRGQSNRHPQLYIEKSYCVPRFVIFGLPSSGKSELARRLCSIWCCEYVNASKLIQRHISSNTMAGCHMLETMRNGNDLQDSDVLKVVIDKLASDECKRFGYVLDDYPTNSQRYKSVTEQLKILCAVSSKPNCYIYVDTNRKEHFRWWRQKRIDPNTGCLYQLNEQGVYERNTLIPSPGSASIGEEPPLFKTSAEQLVTRHEDLVESIEAHFEFYKATMQPALDKYLRDQETAVIHVHSNNIHEDLFTNTIQALYNKSEHPDLRVLDLFGEKDTDDSTKTDVPLISTSTSSKRSRWKKLREAFGCSTIDNQVP